MSDPFTVAEWLEIERIYAPDPDPPYKYYHYSVSNTHMERMLATVRAAVLVLHGGPNAIAQLPADKGTEL